MTTVSEDKRKVEMFEQIKANYTRIIQEKEKDLIKLKKERYVFEDALEDTKIEFKVAK